MRYAGTYWLGEGDSQEPTVPPPRLPQMKCRLGLRPKLFGFKRSPAYGIQKEEITVGYIYCQQYVKLNHAVTMAVSNN